MKIAFESQLFLKGNKTGIAWCADNIIKELASMEECFCNYFSMKYNKHQLGQVRKYQQYGVQMQECKWFHDVLYKLVWPFTLLPYSCFFSKEVDITQFFNYIVPPGVKGKRVVIVHDMAYKVCPETVRLKTKRWLQLTLKGSCKRADAIVTDSESSKKDIVRYLNVSPDKITVMPSGVDLRYFHNKYSDEEILKIKKKYHIRDEYFLYLGTLEPRKNIPNLLRAYKKLLDIDLKGVIPQLVIAGGKGWLFDSIFETVKELNIEGNVLFTGYMEADEVPKIMCGAVAFVFPSIYEGFGIPPLEAMACGTPVITSNLSSLPEVVGDAGILVDPTSVDEICCAMKRIVTDEGLRHDLIEKGLARAQRYTWKNSAEILYSLYKRLLE